MTPVFTSGNRLIPTQFIAFIEPYEASAEPRIRTAKPFQTRVVLVSRDSLLIEDALDDFARANGFCTLAQDHIAFNPAVNFNVETFTPSEDFTPETPFTTRLRWRDRQGREHSKLLLTPPHDVLQTIVDAKPVRTPLPRPDRKPAARKPRAQAKPLGNGPQCH